MVATVEQQNQEDVYPCLYGMMSIRALKDIQSSLNSLNFEW